MPVFVHLTPERNIASIRRQGIGLRKQLFHSRGVYAVPVMPNFYVSHQWLRELKRSKGGTIFGVYFRVPDDEPVAIGHYHSQSATMTAAEAVALLYAAEKRDQNNEPTSDSSANAVRQGHRLPYHAEGFEVIIPRKIERSEIIRVKSLPQVVGWRYYPGANGRYPCICLCCERGQYGARKLLRQVEEAEVKGKRTKIVLFGRENDSIRRVNRLREERKGKRK